MSSIQQSSATDKKWLLTIIAGLVDSLFFIGGIYILYIVRFQTGWIDSPLGIPDLTVYIKGGICILPVYLYLINEFKLYDWGRNTYYFDEIPAFIKVTLLTFASATTLAFFFREQSFSRSLFLLFLIGNFVFLIFSHISIRFIFRNLLPSRLFIINSLIFGGGPFFENVRKHFPEFLNKFISYKIVEYIPFESLDYPNLKSLILEKRIKSIFIIPDINHHNQTYELLKHLEGLNIQIAILPDKLELITSRTEFKTIAGFPFYLVKHAILSPFDRFIKRSFDFIFSGLLLLSLSPVFALISVLVKITSKGPVFFRQERVGLNGESFNCYKFRSMVVDAEVKTGPVWAAKNDTRITSIGRFLRRFSLDELPQIWNVFIGEMSLVGPRPERPFFVEKFKEQVPKYNERHRIKAGMTGWAQVSGLRQDASIEDRTKYDVYYIENWSLWFDIKILFMTVSAVIFGEDAY